MNDNIDRNLFSVWSSSFSILNFHAFPLAIVFPSVRSVVTLFTLQFQFTSLMRAAEKGHKDVVSLLLSAGANIEAADEVILMIHYCMTV